MAQKKGSDKSFVVGAVLSGEHIARDVKSGKIGIDPFDPSLVQPSSIDITLDHRILVFNQGTETIVDLRQPQEHFFVSHTIPKGGYYLLKPRQFALAVIQQRIRVPDDMVARIEGKSSLGRSGLFVHITAGFVDPGWDGKLTLELLNALDLPITLYEGMPIGQISFIKLTEAAKIGYGSKSLNSKYQGDDGPQPSRYWKNFKDSKT